jgi:hypothetical protein
MFSFSKIVTFGLFALTPIISAAPSPIASRVLSSLDTRAAPTTDVVALLTDLKAGISGSVTAISQFHFLRHTSLLKSSLSLNKTAGNSTTLTADAVEAVAAEIKVKLDVTIAALASATGVVITGEIKVVAGLIVDIIEVIIVGIGRSLMILTRLIAFSFLLTRLTHSQPRQLHSKERLITSSRPLST